MNKTAAVPATVPQKIQETTICAESTGCLGLCKKRSWWADSRRTPATNFVNIIGATEKEKFGNKNKWTHLLMCVQFYVYFIWLQVYAFAIYSMVRIHCGSAAFEPGTSALPGFLITAPYYFSSFCVFSFFILRASCVDSKPQSKRLNWTKTYSNLINPRKKKRKIRKIDGGN